MLVTMSRGSSLPGICEARRTEAFINPHISSAKLQSTSVEGYGACSDMFISASLSLPPAAYNVRPVLGSVKAARQ